MRFLRIYMNDKKIEKKYVNAGTSFGDAVSYIYMGECVGFESMLNTWEDWEKEYVSRGYRTVSIDDFIGFGGYGKNIDYLLGKKLDKDEKPVFHAQLYRDNFLGKVSPIIDLSAMVNGNKEPQMGNYILPSTAELAK